MISRSSTYPVRPGRSARRSASRHSLATLALSIVALAIPWSASAQEGVRQTSDRDPCRLEVIPARADEPAREVEVCQSAARGGKWSLVKVSEATSDVRTFDAEDASRRLAAALAAATQEASRDNRSAALTATQKVFSDLSFHDMDLLNKAGRVDGATSDLLGRGRREMMQQAMGEAIRRLQAANPDAKFSIGILDSGNKNSGIASDIDQTLVVLPLDPKADPGVTELQVIDEINKVFQAEFGFLPDRMEVESIDGRDFFPDWRAEHQTIEAFDIEARRVVEQKSQSSALYRTEGELKIQAEGRGWAGLQQHFAAVEDLDRRLAVLDASTDPGAAAERARLEQERQTLLDDSPWTEVEVDPETGDMREIKDSDPRNKGFLQNEPEVTRRFAFDGSYDNWMMYESHPENRPKYLLRSVADGVGLLTSLRPEDGRYDLDRDWEARPVEYEKLTARGQEDTKRQFIRDIYGYLQANGGTGLDEERIYKTLEVASRARLKHKRADGFADLTEAQIYAEYMPDVRHSDRAAEWRMLPEATRLEIAKRAWEVDARELMIENLLRTVRQPADILAGGIDSREWVEIEQKFPGATPAKLKKAAWLQLFHGFRDLMTHDHARAIGQAVAEGRGALGSEPGADGRMTDLVDRMVDQLRRVQGPEAAEARAEIEKVLIDAAASKLQLQPDPADRNRIDEAIGGAFLDAMRSRLQSASLFKADFDRVRAELNSGNFENTWHRVMNSVVQSYGEMQASVLNTLGFNGEILRYASEPGELPALEVRLLDGQSWDVGKAVSNLASMGNVEASLSVLLAFQQGDLRDAANQAFLELVMNAPGADWATAAYEAAMNDSYQPLFMTSVGMAMPVVGQAYALVSIATGTVQLLGNAVLQPLQDDRKDMAYQGFLGAENDMRSDQRGQRLSVLSRVPVRVIPATETDNDGNPVTRYVFDEYSRADVFELMAARGSTGDRDLEASDEEYQMARAAGLIGGGEEYRALEDRANDWLGEPRLAFEARRASLWFYYRDRVEAYLRSQHAIDDVDMLFVERTSSQALEVLRPFFSEIVADWAHGRGEFDGVVGGENELLLPQTPADRQKFFFDIGNRMAGDFIRSYRIVALNPIETRAGLVDASIEGQMVEEIWQLVEGERRKEAQQLAAAIDDAYTGAQDREVARAVNEIVVQRRDALRVPAPRVHVRARVVDGSIAAPPEARLAPIGAGSADETGGVDPALADLTDRIQFLISVIADSASFPEPFRPEVQWRWTDEDSLSHLAATVKVFAGNGRQVGDTVHVDIGTLSYQPAAMIAQPEVEARIADEPDEQAPVESVDATVAPNDGILVYDDIRVFFTPERDLTEPFRWRIVPIDTDTQVTGGVWDPESIDLTENTPRAGEGAPGLFVAQPRLWERPAGTYAIQSCEPELSAGLLGQGGHGGCGDEWQTEGTFLVGTRQLHFQRFVVEPGGAGISDGGSWRLRSRSRGGASVTVDGIATLEDGTIVDLGRVVLDFAETIDPQETVSGRIGAALEDASWDLGAELFDLLPTGQSVPDSRLVTQQFASHSLARDGPNWNLRIPRYQNSLGQPDRPFSEWIREPGASWYIPVRVSISAGPPLHGFAVYGAEQVALGPADPDEDEGRAVPRVEGLPAAEAVTLVRDAGLVPAPTVIGDAPSAGDAHTVTRQRPEPGVRLAEGSSVRLELFGAFAEDATKQVPNVRGLTAAVARDRLDAQGLRAEFVVGAVASTEAEAHTVASQSPTATTSVPVGTVVQITLRGAYVAADEAGEECEQLLATGYRAYTDERWDDAIRLYRQAQGAACGELADTGLADAQQRRQETDELNRRWAEDEADRQRQAEAEAERQRQAEEEAERQRQAEAEAERQRQAAAEAERRRQAEEDAEVRRRAEAEAERLRQAEEERQRRATEDALRRVQEDMARACEPAGRGDAAAQAGRIYEALQLWRQAWDNGCQTGPVGDAIRWAEDELDRLAEEQRRQADAWAREQNRQQQCAMMLADLRRAVDGGQNIQALILSFGALLGDCRGPELDEILRRAGGGPPAPPQQLDDVFVPSPGVNISVWDHGSQDGDYVTIWVNGYVVLSEYLLTNQRYTFPIQLDPFRPNEIRIFAHNEGTSPPNTAAISVSPAAQGGNQTWNLNTNQIAIARVIVR